LSVLTAFKKEKEGREQNVTQLPDSFVVIHFSFVIPNSDFSKGSHHKILVAV
jgi:hypothetical protein